MQPPANDDEQKHRRARWLADAYSMGLTFPAAIILGLGGGWWLDKFFGTWPWLTIILGALGVAAAFVTLFRLATRDDGTGQ
jgi:ATP synthase protein I